MRPEAGPDEKQASRGSECSHFQQVGQPGLSGSSCPSLNLQTVISGAGSGGEGHTVSGKTFPSSSLENFTHADWGEGCLMPQPTGKWKN